MVQRRTYTCRRKSTALGKPLRNRMLLFSDAQGLIEFASLRARLHSSGITAFAWAPLSKRENSKVAKTHQIKVSGPGQPRMIRGSPLQNSGVNLPCKHEEISPRNLGAKEALEDIRKSSQESRSPSNDAREEKICLRTVEPKQRRKRRPNPSEHLRARAIVQAT